ncbi:ATP-binding cassette domain-containing protein [Actinokineospora bangkokensis]|uniref:Daunorubicin/doxorubicin resistance ABC transporter ATP-binding protein DrrA n=1 Tax=Actinokineospora bangkokensis TaxID=1193682 RepID=A0A1Q9LNN6_9PSEU|nr:ATP-binding cassette domain-containing protein [Actinokineospora bangkokensis]OLR93666.1 daunorubicin/doxorubicin resistance ABC transporter ATP-binding protein DrrA [Actinokineospora bangkokensis]
MDYAIEAEGLRKDYGSHQALRGIDLAVPSGSVLGVLGPNGAGKTTTVRILATLLDADGGTATVAGHDVRRAPAEVRRRIGLTGQYAALDDTLTGRENLRLVGVLHRLGRARARAVAEELLASFELTDAADRPVKGYSGGMRRRLDLAASLVAEPSVLFLDEPTTGLDPHSRNTLWQRIRSQVQAGVTVLLTTQYLEEADQLADRVVVVDAGQVIAEGTPDELKRKVGGERLAVTLADPAQSATAAAALSRVGAEAAVAVGERVVQVGLRPGIGAIAEAAAALAALGVEVEDFGVRRPSLDDVFLALTGHGAAA